MKGQLPVIYRVALRRLINAALLPFEIGGPNAYIGLQIIARIRNVRIYTRAYRGHRDKLTTRVIPNSRKLVWWLRTLYLILVHIHYWYGIHVKNSLFIGKVSKQCASSSGNPSRYVFLFLPFSLFFFSWHRGRSIETSQSRYSLDDNSLIISCVTFCNESWINRV